MLTLTAEMADALNERIAPGDSVAEGDEVHATELHRESLGDGAGDRVTYAVLVNAAQPCQRLVVDEDSQPVEDSPEETPVNSEPDAPVAPPSA